MSSVNLFVAVKNGCSLKKKPKNLHPYTFLEALEMATLRR